MQHTKSGTGLLVATVVAVLGLCVGLTGGPAAATEPPGPVEGQGDTVGDTVAGANGWSATADWSVRLPGSAVSTSSPVVVDNAGNPFVVAGDNVGNLRAFTLATGAAVPGWGSTSVGFPLRAPLSSDGTNVYVPVAQDGKDRYPRFRKFSGAGALMWDSNPGTALPANGSSGFLLSGLSLTQIGGVWRGFGGSSGHWVYGVNGTSGAKLWEFRNADSTMATPALADLYGTGVPQVITSNDTTAEFPHDRHGGILRILDADGRQVCTATQLVSGNTYAASGYNNASPVVAMVDGRPLIAFGSTGPVQHGVGGNQVVAYDESCVRRWASPPLAAQAGPSPSLVDLDGTGVLRVVQVLGISDGASTYPRVYVLNASTGAILRDSGTSLRSYGAALAYPPSVQLTSADVDGDGGQDLFVPARQGRLLVLDGSDLGVLGTVPTNMAIQNTPIVTEENDGVRLTLAGYNGLGSVVSSYLIDGASLGEGGWTTFGNDAQRTGTQGDVGGPREQLLEGQRLGSGAVLRSRSGVHTLTMQTDGNLVVRDGAGGVRWQTATNTAGSTALLERDGRLSVRSPQGAQLWTSGARGFGTERLALGDDGDLRVNTGYWTATRRLTTMATVWRSGPVRQPGPTLARGQILGPGAVIRSSDGVGVLTMQTDGNLVFRRSNTVVWQSGSRDGSGNAYAMLRADGDLVVIGQGDRMLFSTQTNGRGGDSLHVKDRNTLVIRTAGGANIWVNGTRSK